MAETKRDDNLVNVMMGVLNTDGSTPTRVQIDPTSHILQTSDASSGSDLGADNAARDNSGYPVLLAVGSGTNVPTPLYVNSSGQLIIQST